MSAERVVTVTVTPTGVTTGSPQEDSDTVLVVADPTTDAIIALTTTAPSGNPTGKALQSFLGEFLGDLRSHENHHFPYALRDFRRGRTPLL
jgi:hypothetical protein